jgi:hypothetical protein
MKETGANTAMMVARDGDDGEADLVGGFERGAIGRLAHLDVADDVFDLDDRIIDQNAGHQRHASRLTRLSEKPR